MSKEPSAQAAFDAGEGHRCITHDRTNPYDAATQPTAYAAWERGWQQMDQRAQGLDRPEFLG